MALKTSEDPFSTPEQTTGALASHLKAGIYVPTVAFFDGEQQVDLQTTEKHVQMLAHAGITGIVTHGSNGEAVHLSHQERKLIIQATRRALKSCGYGHMTIVAGCSAQSTKETIALCNDAAENGADFVLVLPPSYYGTLLTGKLVLDHFRAVADASAIPLVVYNFPAIQGGFDLNSDQIIELSAHPNIVGVKLTCGNTGKLTRIAAATASSGFATMGGSADFLLPTLIARGQGVIAGVGNLCPKTLVQVMLLYEQGRVTDAQDMAVVLANGDWVAIKLGFIAVKIGLRKFYGYGGLPRLPCAVPKSSVKTEIEQGFTKLMELETSI
jgi:4-hydroxy-2-oxoglutarate aldolase